MVQSLFAFIQESRTRNWLQHLSSVQDLVKDFIAMDQREYRKAWLVYIAQMKSLEAGNPKIWNYFIEENFSVQKSDIPRLAIE